MKTSLASLALIVQQMLTLCESTLIRASQYHTGDIIKILLRKGVSELFQLLIMYCHKEEVFEENYINLNSR